MNVQREVTSRCDVKNGFGCVKLSNDLKYADNGHVTFSRYLEISIIVFGLRHSMQCN